MLDGVALNAWNTHIVQKWKSEHPEGKKADCIRDTGLDKKTIYKWWNENK